MWPFRIPQSAFAIEWRAWGDLNTRHTAPEAVALSGLSYRRKRYPKTALRTTGVSPWVKALLAREFEGAKTLKENRMIFRKCHGRKPVGIYSTVHPAAQASGRTG